MTDKQTQAMADHSNMEKDPSTWVTGDEPMTGAQRSYLKTLSEEAKEDFDDTLSKAQASVRIDELQQLTGRAPPDHQPVAQQARPQHDTRRADGTAVTAEGLDVSRSGAVMGKPEAEHGAYGMVREGSAEAANLTEEEIRGTKGSKAG
jgi:hypothetical protein